MHPYRNASIVFPNEYISDLIGFILSVSSDNIELFTAGEENNK